VIPGRPNLWDPIRRRREEQRALVREATAILRADRVRRNQHQSAVEPPAPPPAAPLPKSGRYTLADLAALRAAGLVP
jgi:hypothetical protein